MDYFDLIKYFYSKSGKTSTRRDPYKLSIIINLHQGKADLFITTRPVPWFSSA